MKTLSILSDFKFIEEFLQRNEKNIARIVIFDPSNRDDDQNKIRFIDKVRFELDKNEKLGERIAVEVIYHID